MFKTILSIGGKAVGTAVDIAGGASLRTWGLIAGGVALIGVLLGAYLFITGLVDEKARLTAELATQRIETQMARVRAAQIENDHDASVERIEVLEKTRTDNETEMTDLRAQIDAMNIEEEINRDPQAGARSFNTQSHGLNRLLERLSRGQNRSLGRRDK